MEERKGKNIRTGEEFLIKEFSRENVVDIYQIIQENFPFSWDKEQILSENIFSKKIVLYVENYVAGFLFGEIIYEDASILLLAVKKEHQGKGYGKLLLKTFIDICRKEKVEKISLEVSLENKKAINLYKKSGFKEIGIRRRYYKDGTDALLMELKI